MKKNLIRSLLFILICVVLIFISYFYVDRQLVWFLVAHHSHRLVLLKVFANDIVYVLSFGVFLYYIYYFFILSMNRVTALNKNILLSCNAVVIALFLKDFLKYVFGRYWAATYVCKNPSLVNNHAYGFNWFKTGTAYASFPSGHTSFIFAFSACMWFLFPKLRWLWVLLASLVVIGQLGMYYHFVSDVIAGAMLGSLVGFYCFYSRVVASRLQ